MRRLSEKQKRRLLRHAILSHRRSSRRRGRLYVAPGVRRVNSLRVPERLSFEHNYEETLAFFNRLRYLAGIPRAGLKIDFTTLQDVGPAAALVLAAELDCWRRSARKPIRVLDIHKWNRNVRFLLDEMGLFDLVQVVNPPPSLGQAPLRFIRFKSGKAADGELAKELRIDLEKITGEIPDWQDLYRGLAEAMTNVRQHAYEGSGSGNHERWWMFGAYHSPSKLLTCAFFDRGVGIPATLPRTHRERLAGLLEKLRLPNSDASMIAAAMELGRTRTGLQHQGRGLADVQKFVEHSENGMLRILSRGGQYIYLNGKREPSSLPSPIGGTLIEWTVTLPERETADDRDHQASRG